MYNLFEPVYSLSQWQWKKKMSAPNLPRAATNKDSYRRIQTAPHLNLTSCDVNGLYLYVENEIQHSACYSILNIIKGEQGEK